MKLLVLANDAVGAQICHYLADEYREDLALVVTHSDNALYDQLKGRGVPVAERSFLNDIDAVRRLNLDLGILAWWPSIIRAPLLSVPKQGWINTHPSLLPFNRGKHYSFWAIVDRVPFGVTLHEVDEGIDSGPIVAQRCIPYDWTDTGHSLYEKAQSEIVRLFRESYPAMRSGAVVAVPQDSAIGERYYHAATDIDQACRLDLNRSYSLRAILDLLRARTFPGRPACFFFDDDCEYEVTVCIRRKR